MIQHVVLMKFADASNRDEAKQRLEGLPASIPQLLSLAVSLDIGTDATPSDLVLISTHADREGLRGYVEHPVHQEFVAWVKPLLVGRAAVDSEIGRPSSGVSQDLTYGATQGSVVERLA